VQGFWLNLCRKRVLDQGFYNLPLALASGNMFGNRFGFSQNSIKYLVILALAKSKVFG